MSAMQVAGLKENGAKVEIEVTVVVPTEVPLPYTSEKTK